jgi:methylated-DNA-protein-cysteine methyltransferase-like protein
MPSGKRNGVICQVRVSYESERQSVYVPGKPLCGYEADSVGGGRRRKRIVRQSGVMPSAKPKHNAAWERVYRTVKTVPAGRVVTYGQLARLAKLRGGAREAGHAMAASPRERGIPWHRVVGAGGRLLIREPLASLQRRLLQSEKTPFSGHHVDLTASGWISARKQRARCASRSGTRTPAHRRK